MIQDAKLTVGIGAGCQFNSVDTQNDILQGLRVQTILCVGNIRVDNDQIVDIHRKDLILDNKLTLAADNIKQFRMLVCMGNRMPVTAVFGSCYI